MRLDKYISSASDLSRSEVRRLIKQRQVRINDAVVVNNGLHVTDQDRVELLGNELVKPQLRYFQLNKPTEVVCATLDSQHRTVIDLLSEHNLHTLHIAGRLDVDSTGLVLLTDDGQWTHRVISPKRSCSKIYHVKTIEPISAESIEAFHKGVQLQGEKKVCQPAKLELFDERSCKITLNEGKYHQIKRMFGMFGNRVIGLHRVSIGEIQLDEQLAPGQYRSLTESEITSV